MTRACISRSLATHAAKGQVSDSHWGLNNLLSKCHLARTLYCHELTAHLGYVIRVQDKMSGIEAAVGIIVSQPAQLSNQKRIADLTLQACVAAIVSAYHDGSSVVRKIKEKRAARKRAAPTGLLEESLEQSPRGIEAEKDRGLARFGQTFDRGDAVAIEALRQVKIEIKAALFESLVHALQTDEMMDFTAVLNTSDLGRGRTIMALIELQQRLMVAGPISQMSTSLYSQSYAEPAWQQRPSFQNRQPQRVMTIYEADPPPSLQRTQPDQGPPWRDGLSSARLPSTEEDTAPIFAVRADSVVPQGAGLPKTTQPLKSQKSDEYSPSYLPSWNFKLRKSRTKSENASSSQIPSLIELGGGNFESHSQIARPIRAAGALRSTSLEHAVADLHGTDDPRDSVMYGEFEDTVAVWGSMSTGPNNPSDSAISPLASGPLSHCLQSYPMSLNLPVPTEDNGFLGFCKGAWKLQNGSSSAFKQRLEFNNGWSQSEVPYLACSSNKCAFAGRLPPATIHKVWRTKGVALRWRFLAKSHVPQDRVENDQFGFLCMFCTLSGKKKRVYFGTNVLLEHLAEHRSDPLPPEILHRSRCVTGRVAGDDDNFDVNLLPPDIEKQRKGSACLSDSLQTTAPGEWHAHADCDDWPENADSLFGSERHWT